MQPELANQPEFELGEMVIYGDGICRVLGREQFVPNTFWFYLLGAKVGSSKMIWHTRVPEFDLMRPCFDNVEELHAR